MRRLPYPRRHNATFREGPAEPGSVIYTHLAGLTKRRPWLVLWLDDEACSVALAPCTSQNDYVGVVETHWTQQPYVGGWVMIQPFHVLHGGDLAAVRMPHDKLVAVRRQLIRNLDLDE